MGRSQGSNYPSLHRTAPTIKNDPSPYVNSPEVEKPQIKIICWGFNVFLLILSCYTEHRELEHRHLEASMKGEFYIPNGHKTQSLHGILWSRQMCEKGEDCVNSGNWHLVLVTAHSLKSKLVFGG